jgi:hypothetical protein
MTDTATTPSEPLPGRTGQWELVMVVDTRAQVATKAHSFAVATL